ncbi:COX15/CtaA family protein [Mycetocola zhujimingii]|uniref:COX15/CtaA family protein n=1 Tax=Mycetocola zhujimingii TaxID=2079792 RepID=UPI0039F67279
MTVNAISQAARRFWDWLPTGVDRRVRVIAWLNLAAQTALVGTGGAVRLTGSGLGCPTWPRCTAESFVSTPEMGIHGVIEFGNRTLFFVLQFIALTALFFVLKYRRQRRDLFILTVIPACSVLFQAVVGGITVLSGLNPYVVGLHFVLSVVLVVLASVLVYRVYNGNGERTLAVPRWFAITTHVTTFFVAVTVIIGIITTGSGPHAGDKGAARNGLDSELLQHLHAWPAYVTFGLTIVLLVAAVSLGLEKVRRNLTLLLAVELVQIAVGLAQARMGLPEILVGIHMVLACVLAAAMTVTVLSMKSTAPALVDAEPAEAVRAS